MGTVLAGFEGLGTKAILINLGNMYGRHCMMARAEQHANEVDETGRPLCRYHCFPLRDEHGESTWPEKITTQQLNRASSIMGWAKSRQEIDCKVADEDSTFRDEWFHDFDCNSFDLSNCMISAALDPSGEPNAQADPKAMVVLARPIGTNKAYCLYAWIRNASPLEMCEQLFLVANRYGPGYLGAESVGGEMLNRFYVLHCVAIPLLAVLLMGVHFWRIRKDGGISGPL